MIGSNKKPEATDIHIGRRVQERRKQLGLSQERLGEQLGITFQQVQKYEKGTNRIGAGRLFSISEILDAPIGFFFRGLENGPVPSGGLSEGDGQPALSPPDGSEVESLVADFERINDPIVRATFLELVRAVAANSESGLGRRTES